MKLIHKGEVIWELAAFGAMTGHRCTEMTFNYKDMQSLYNLSESDLKLKMGHYCTRFSPTEKFETESSKIEALKLELEQIKEAICIVCIEEMFTDEPFVTDADCIDTFVRYAKGLKEI